MEMLIAFAAVVLIAVCVLHRPQKPTENRITAERAIADIYTVLENVEIYDGTPKGQKRIGGDR